MSDQGTVVLFPEELNSHPDQHCKPTQAKNNLGAIPQELTPTPAAIEHYDVCACVHLSSFLEGKTEWRVALLTAQIAFLRGTAAASCHPELRFQL